LEILDTSAELFASLNAFNEEQKNNMKPYLGTIYMATFTFLIISFIMIQQFLAPLVATSADPTTAQSGLLSGVYDINYYTSLLFWGALLESIFGGLVIGKIVYSDMTAGLTHSIVLITITLIFFNILTI
ncbi:MAG: hypothetical protein GX638_05935, partial [Crenarchaeota archaeon]|nr:hypothetical protein [Thermoproteota archaeon]